MSATMSPYLTSLNPPNVSHLVKPHVKINNEAGVVHGSATQWSPYIKAHLIGLPT